MVELSSTQSFGAAAKILLPLVSDQWSIFGPTFKMGVPVTEAGTGVYKIAKADWDATLGPLFDRFTAELRGRDKNSDEYYPISVGYTAMDSAETRALHQLVQSFGAASDPDYMKAYPGTPETNAYLAQIKTFVDTLNGPEQAVLVTRTQLQGLADMARGALEYVHEGDRLTPGAKAFYEGFAHKPGVRYSNGLVNWVL